LPDHVHIAPGRFEAAPATGLVVDDPFGKANRAFDAQSRILNAPPEIT